MDAQDAMAVLLTYVCDVRAAGFEDPQSQQAPSMVTSAKSNTFGDSRAAVNNASKRKWDSPRVWVAASFTSSLP